MIEVKEKINENEKNVINVANLINKNVLSFYNMIYDFDEITHDKLLDYELKDEKRISPSNDTLINTYTLEEVYKNIRELTSYICEYYIQYNTIDYKCIEEFIGFISNYLLKESLQSILIWYNKNIDFIYSTNVKCISNIVFNCISEIIEKYRETIFKDIEDFFKK